MSARNRWLVRSSPVGSSHAEALRSRTPAPEPPNSRCRIRPVCSVIVAVPRQVEVRGSPPGRFLRAGDGHRIPLWPAVRYLPRFAPVQAQILVPPGVGGPAEPDLV